MESIKKLSVSIALAGAVFAVTASPVGAVTTAYWGDSTFYSSQQGGPTMWSNKWVTSSTANEVVIKGYQDSRSSTSPAKVEYAVVKDELIGWGDYWVHQTIAYNYPQGGTWYSHTFKGIPNGIEVAIQITARAGISMNVGGNAYQS